MITTALICGGGVGAGIALIVRYLRPPHAPLRIALDALNGVVMADLNAVAGKGDLVDQVGGPFVPLLIGLGLSVDKLNADLAITDRSIDRHLAEKVTLGIFGALLVPITASVMLIGGVQIPLAIPVWTGVALGLVFFFAPDIGVRSDAQRRRRDFRHGLSSFLDLVVIGLAGGGGVEGALDGACGVGGSWAFARIRRTLEDARLSRQTPWAALGALGEELGVGELVELAASVGLAGTEGAKVRQSLDAKARSLRSHQLSEAEGEAQSASERMSLPVVLLFGGFLMFIGYPALSRVLSGL